MQDCTVAAAVECWENNKSFILVSLAKTTTSTEIVYEIFSVLGTCKMEERSRMVVLLVGKPPEICTITSGLGLRNERKREKVGGGEIGTNRSTGQEYFYMSSWTSVPAVSFQKVGPSPQVGWIWFVTNCYYPQLMITGEDWDIDRLVNWKLCFA